MLFPVQGEWTEEEYLALDTNCMVELVDGSVDVLPLPVPLHQLIVAYLCMELNTFVAPQKSGRVFFAPMPVRLGPRNFREPDVMYLKHERLTDLRKQPEGADLIMEVVSPGEESRNRDYGEKRKDYAAAGIAEYWIVDPEEKRITVLTLDGQAYREHGVFGMAATATSILLPGFSVVVEKVFSVA